ncbi:MULTISPECIES: hypothetical protein [Aquimarina]|uniref:Uncharacterized protein n=1 Tax=Aquimarina algiphila TaxID=2047982 RepID=A0A554VAR9_9FLAO|nr:MULTISPECIES: hypothetical protein [Aquimarina]TSE03368.1 hypothetical protein FOF46_29510 [Aquimarina algiphila]
MKKKQLKKLKLNKNTISKIGAEKIQGGGTHPGYSTACDSSLNLECNLGCATGDCQTQGC